MVIINISWVIFYISPESDKVYIKQTLKYEWKSLPI